MLIDWFTVCAQALNFLILVWLMQRFLYRPILRAIDARERLVAGQLADADQKRLEAQKERDTFLSKNEAFERSRAERLSQMNDEVETERFRLLDEVRQAADALQSKRLETLRDEARQLSQAISQRAQQEVFAIARKTLADLATASLEEQMADVFVRNLRTLSEKEKRELKAALNVPSGPTVVRSAFELPASRRGEIEILVRELNPAETPIGFEVAPNLVSGIELLASGQKIAWNISAYLQALEKGVGELLEVKPAPETLAEPPPEVNGTGTLHT